MYVHNRLALIIQLLQALLSSILSVILALLSAFLEFPKHYYIYQIGKKLKTSENPKLRKRLRMTKTIFDVIWDSLDLDA